MKQWKTKVTVLDTETGEELTKKHVEQGLYVIIKKTSKTTVKHEHNLEIFEKTIRWHCEKNRQQELFEAKRII